MAEGSRLALVRTDDPAVVNAILHDPVIASKLRTGKRLVGYLAHPLVAYWLAMIDGSPVGVFTAVSFTEWEVEAHVAILPAGLQDARRLCRMFLAEVFKAAEVMRVTAYVLASLPTAANLCRRLGFFYEGRRHNACLVNGKPCDVLIFAMLRGKLGYADDPQFSESIKRGRVMPEGDSLTRQWEQYAQARGLSHL